LFLSELPGLAMKEKPEDLLDVPEFYIIFPLIRFPFSPTLFLFFHFNIIGISIRKV